MSKLTLQYEGIVLKEYALGTGVTIGRLPDNAVIIDNPAVSGHHARVYLEGQHVVLEDLRSTNGTFVNGRPITRQVLQHGDEVLVGKHQLVFDRTATEAQPVTTMPMEGLGDTVYLDGGGSAFAASYLWSLRAPAGSGAVLADANARQTAFLADLPGSYEVTLTVDAVRIRARSAQLHGTASVDGKTVAEADLLSILAEMPDSTETVEKWREGVPAK